MSQTTKSTSKWGPGDIAYDRINRNLHIVHKLQRGQGSQVYIFDGQNRILESQCVRAELSLIVQELPAFVYSNGLKIEIGVWEEGLELITAERRVKIKIPGIVKAVAERMAALVDGAVVDMESESNGRRQWN